MLVSGRGDEHGYHLYRAAAKDGWTWRPLASLEPGGFADDTWVGN